MFLCLASACSTGCSCLHEVHQDAQILKITILFLKSMLETYRPEFSKSLLLNAGAGLFTSGEATLRVSTISPVPNTIISKVKIMTGMKWLILRMLFPGGVSLSVVPAGAGAIAFVKYCNEAANGH